MPANLFANATAPEPSSTIERNDPVAVSGSIDLVAPRFFRKILFNDTVNPSATPV